MFASDSGGFAEYLHERDRRVGQSARRRRRPLRHGRRRHDRAGVLKQLNEQFDLTSWRKQKPA